MLSLQKRQAEAMRPLNQKMELWQRNASTEKDALGGDVDVDKHIADIWAYVTRVRANEVSEVGRVVPYAYYKIIIHYRADIDEAMYLKYAGKELDINSIIDTQERHKYLELQCTERVKPHG